MTKGLKKLCPKCVTQAIWGINVWPNSILSLHGKGISKIVALVFLLLGFACHMFLNGIGSLF